MYCVVVHYFMYAAIEHCIKTVVVLLVATCMLYTSYMTSIGLKCCNVVMLWRYEESVVCT